jgi:Tol biopolymer transport system component
VPFGAKAYSPDGTKYAREIEPKDQGRIGIFDRQTDVLLREVRLTETNNELKGLAYAPDSTQIAIMYHHGGGGCVAVVSVNTGEKLNYVSIDRWYHYLVFSTEGTKLIVSYSGFEGDANVFDISSGEKVGPLRQ